MSKCRSCFDEIEFIDEEHCFNCGAIICNSCSLTTDGKCNDCKDEDENDQEINDDIETISEDDDD